MSGADRDDAPLLPAQLTHKVRWRLGLPIILFMLFSSLDRVNISFAALQMNAELGFTPTQYGFGAGILFAGFLLGQYPSLLLHQRFGMRRWIAICAVLWGLSALAMIWVREPWHFYSLRVLIGLAEGGLAPGFVLYLAQFSTRAQRATTFALPMLAIPISVVIGGPLSGWLMGVTAPGGLSGWRWMMVCEAAPTILLGIAAWFYFPDTPRAARWLNDLERDSLDRLAARREGADRRNDWSVLRQPLIWQCALLWFCLLCGSYGIIFWLPLMIRELAQLSPIEIGVVNALPWMAAMVGMYFNARHSDRTGERYWHVGLPAALASAAIAAAWLLGPGAAGLLLLTLAGLALGCAQGAFWSVPTTVLAGPTFMVGTVAINILGSAGGWVMPQLMGVVREQSASYAGPTALVASILLSAALLVLSIAVRGRHTR